MRKKELKRYIEQTFAFDLSQERIAYLYLCKKRLSRKQRKKLKQEFEFASYDSWVSYLTDKYEPYNQKSLIEFDRALNLLLLEYKRFDSFQQNFCVAYISAFLSVMMSEIIAKQEVEIATLVLMPFGLALLVSWIYNEYILGGIDVYFLQDVKEIVGKLISER